MPAHRLLVLDPGHFHAALTLRTRHPRLADEVVVYGPDGADRRDFLTLVERFNARVEAPTRWRIDVVTTDDPCGRLIDERRGDVVVLAGKNGGKARLIHRLHAAGFHVLADKPWLVHPSDLPDIRASLAGWPLAMEIMTGRHDVAARLLRRLVTTVDVFGAFRTDGVALEQASVHHLAKLVDGVPLRRPWWYFDVRVQGGGAVDIPTHLVDRAQWLLDEGTAPELLSVRRWPTRVPLGLFRRITGEADVPPALAPVVEGDALGYDGNAELDVRLGGIAARARATWALSPPPGGGDTSCVIARGTRADVRLEQSAATGYRRQLVVEAPAEARHALAEIVAAWQADFPGAHVAPLNARAAEVVIPPGLDGGHEAHFALVRDAFLTSIDEHRWPRDVAARTLAKYALLADAAARA